MIFPDGGMGVLVGTGVTLTIGRGVLVGAGVGVAVGLHPIKRMASKVANVNLEHFTK
jgi:hypothetical protein